MGNQSRLSEGSEDEDQEGSYGQAAPKRGRSTGGGYGANAGMDPYGMMQYGQDDEVQAHLSAMAANFYASAYPGGYPSAAHMGSDNPYADAQAAAEYAQAVAYHQFGMGMMGAYEEDATAAVVVGHGRDQANGKKGGSRPDGREGSQQPRLWEGGRPEAAAAGGRSVGKGPSTSSRSSAMAAATAYDYMTQYGYPGMGFPQPYPGRGAASMVQPPSSYAAGRYDGGAKRGSPAVSRGAGGRPTNDAVPAVPGPNGRNSAGRKPSYSPDDGPAHPMPYSGYEHMHPAYMYPGQQHPHAAAPPSYTSTPGPTTGAVVKPRAMHPNKVAADYEAAYQHPSGAFHPYQQAAMMAASSYYGGGYPHNPYMDPAAMHQHYSDMSTGRVRAAAEPDEEDNDDDDGHDHSAATIDPAVLMQRWNGVKKGSSGGGAAPSDSDSHPMMGGTGVMAALQNIRNHMPAGGIDPMLLQEGAAAIAAAAAAAAHQRNQHNE